MAKQIIYSSESIMGNCLIEDDWSEAKKHGMKIEEFYKMPEDFKRKYYCSRCKNINC